MSITDTLEQDLRRRYQSETAAQMAAAYGISHDHMRRILSDIGLRDPKRTESQRKAELIRKFWGRGEVRTIAQYLDMSEPAVRVRAYRMGLTQQPKLDLR